MSTTANLHTDNTHLKEKVAFLEEENCLLHQQVRFLKNRLYGRKSEQGLTENDGQLSLGLEGDAPEVQTTQKDEGTVVTTHKRKKPGRRPLPEDLPREDVFHQVPDSERVCACGHDMKVIGYDVTEQLDVEPAKAKVIRRHREKLACPACEGTETEGATVKIAPAPGQLIPKSFATPGLLAYIMAGKFVDSLPFYRQESRFARMGVNLKRATMCNWSVQVAENCRKLIDLLLESAKKSGYLQIDETTVQVMGEPGRKNTTKSYMWVIRGGPPDKPIAVYLYNPTRSGTFIAEVLADYSGYVQTDGYVGYDQLERREGVTLLACMAHARRKFADVCKTSKKKGFATEAMGMFKQLYAIEACAAEEGLNAAQRQVKRRREAVPVLNNLERWLDATKSKVPPKSLLGTAVKYTLNLWPRLTKYVEDGRLGIDNNPVENTIRPFVVGRKNWLFSGSPEGAAASATLYSLVITARANGWDPYIYLRHAFEGLITAESEADYLALLPTNTPPSTPL